MEYIYTTNKSNINLSQVKKKTNFFNSDENYIYNYTVCDSLMIAGDSFLECPVCYCFMSTLSLRFY